MERLSIVKRHFCSSKRAKKELDQVLREWRGNCFKIIFNRPKQFNAMGGIMYYELLKAIDEANTAKVCLLKSTSAGKVFCAGADLKELVGLLTQQKKEGFVRYNKAMLGMAVAKPITIAFWDGIVMGGGAGISVNCNVKIATENTVFGMPEAKLGYFTNVGASYFLSRFRKNIGLFLAMTAYSLKGKEACQVGVADYFVHSKDIPALEAEIEKLSQIPTVNEALIRETVEKFAEKVEGVYEGEDLIAEIFQGKDVHEVLEKLKQESQKNAVVKKWYEDVLQCCPLSHLYDFELLRRGKELNLHEGLSLEDYLALKINFSDFTEGVRTVLVDKGSKPRWSVSYDELKKQKVEDYFPEKLQLIDYANRDKF